MCSARYSSSSGGRLTKWILTGLAALLASASTAMAQDPRLPNLPTGVRSSPFDPPTQDVFVADQGPGLDTGCTFNTDPNHPLIIDVLIDQAVGPVDANGYLVNPGQLVADGVIPPNVEVILPAYDVDVNGTPPPENDVILLNGTSLGTLSGDNNIWKLNSFGVSISRIKFPAPTTSGPPTPVANRIQINVDTLSVGRWCTAIDWVALVLPVQLKSAVTLVPSVANPIRVRSYDSEQRIDVIYQETFDASCNVTNDAEDYDEYPFSGAADPGSAQLQATVARCPANPQRMPEVKVDWKVTGSGVNLKGTTNWTGSSGKIDVSMPDTVGIYDAELTFTIDEKPYPPIHRKLFVTRKPPALSAPRLGWYELATSWASGQKDEGPILTSLLGGLYGYGQSNWRYGYDFGSVTRCEWEELVENPIQCDYADCHVFSRVFENLAATVGVGGLTSLVPTGSSSQGFLTNATPSLDPAFPGSVKLLGSSTYDRYLFANHSLRKKGSKYYDATFNGIYSSSSAFIAANLDGSTGSDPAGGYFGTSEGWKVYDLFGNSYDSWGDYAYRMPSPPAPGGIDVGEVSFEGRGAGVGLEFPGTVAFTLVDEDTDGKAEALRAAVEVRIGAGDQYTVAARLLKGGQLVSNRPSWESMLPVRVTLDEIPGTYTVTLDFSGEQIRRSSLDGPYDLELTGLSSSGVASAILPTPPYSRTAFGEIATQLGSVTESAVDADGDGRFEAIEVLASVDVRLAGEVRLQASLSKGEQTLVGAAVTQTLAAGPQQVALRLDGTAIARAGLDGPFEGTVNLRDASGATLESSTFTTQPYPASSFAVLVEPQAPYADEGIDTNGNALFDVLRVGFGAQFARGGSYTLTAVLRGAASSSAVYAETSLSVPAGPAALSVDFRGPQIHALELDGPYTVDLLLRDAVSLELLDSLRLPFTTAAYQADEFEPFGASNLPIQLTGNSSDAGVDLNGNGLFDRLHVEVEVALARADTYEWSARLVDPQGAEIGFSTRRMPLAAGLANLTFDFAAPAIAKNGTSGPYFVKSLLIFGLLGDNLVSVEVAQTAAYPISAFEGAGDFTAPQITVAEGPALLWPPDGRLETFNVADFVLAASDETDPQVSVADVVITEVTSDEPAASAAKGGGGEDIVIATGCRSVELRAARVEGGNGRVYTIHVAVADWSGNVGRAQFQVGVPQQLGGPDPIDDGAAYTVEGCKP